jgi:hypothetical protein
MKNLAKKIIFIPIINFLSLLGFDFVKIIALKNYFKFRRDKKKWIKKRGKINKNCMILSDYESYAGIAKGDYFHQDLLVANLIYNAKPKRHIDIGSRIDGFVAHVASFRKIEIIDVRKLEKSEHQNLQFIQADMMEPKDLGGGEVDSISCLHTIEHFGLGRYGEKIDIDGHVKGITNIVNILSKNGYLYISFPIGKNDEVHFNAQRILGVSTILTHPSISKNMELVRFDYVDQAGNLFKNIKLQEFISNMKKKEYYCGIYTFKKIYDH